MTSDKNGVYRGVYTYGQERISVRDLVEVEGVPNNPLYYLYDGRGSVTQLTNSVGNVRDKYRYTPFGVPMSGGKLSPNTKLLNNPYGYNGEYHDLESGFQYLRARYYNPETARFITRDSYLGDINEPLSLNRYAYTENNPVMNIDPSGHKPVDADDNYGSGGGTNITKPTAQTQEKPVLEIYSTDKKLVKTLQTMLQTIGYDIGKSGVDGYFETDTFKAVKAFQANAGLQVNGKVGGSTWKKLEEAYNNVLETGMTGGIVKVVNDKSNVKGSAGTGDGYVKNKLDQTNSYNDKGCGDERKDEPVLGSDSYARDIEKIVKGNGARKALDKIMYDVDKYGNQLDDFSSDNVANFNALVSFTLEKVGFDGIDKKIHYFRNKLNRAPKSLDEMIKLNKNLSKEKRWKLLDPLNAIYHMQGENGQYNLKFVSSDGHFEAVYNKDGILLTEVNDPINMGTYNYFGPDKKKAHENYDVDPYFKWGNTDPSQGGDKYIETAKNYFTGYGRWADDLYAVARYLLVKEQVNP